MIIYSGTLRQLDNDVTMGVLADKIEELFSDHGLKHNNASEHRSWNNSLERINSVVNHIAKLDGEIHVAIEYQIPMTSKRVDFLITGFDENNVRNAVIIELKQWETSEITNKNDLIMTFVGGANRLCAHPCYQAYSYAKTIENFNSTVLEDKIGLYPCAYLHNYSENNRNQIDNDFYNEAISLAPIFLQRDALKLANYIQKYIKKPDNGEILYIIENGKIKPSVALQDALSSLMKHNEVFTLIDEQIVAFSSILSIITESLKTNQKHTIIVKGGPGTGKTVIAIRLLEKLISDGLNVNYVTKNSAPRNVFLSKLLNNDFKKIYIQNLFKGSGSYVKTANNTFDCLLVDEAHRLNEISGMFHNQGYGQINELINAARVSVFFLDEDQIVTTQDFGSLEHIKKAAEAQYSIVHEGLNYTLSSQFRCGGSDGYLAFLDDVLGIKETANYTMEGLDYDVKIFDTPQDMRSALRIKNDVNNKSRMVAGYCYNWISKKDISLFDIVLNDNFKAKWNFGNTTTWAIDEDSFEQVGCIHTSQGLEFDYVGVIIGNDLRYENNKVITDYTKRAKTDCSLKGIKSNHNFALADKIIRNTYRTLLSRGQKGCYIYCEDKELLNYLKKRINNY